MISLRIRASEYVITNRFYSVKAAGNVEKKGKSYQHTVFLPKTDFPKYLKNNKIAERDKRIQEEVQFSQFYSWQRENLRGKEFVLHDGPPYANGKPHMGHAINKILKDIILRTQAIQGNRVHYVPGWDCHGLPIELKALKDGRQNLTAKEIREKARKVASSMAKTQMNAFKQWGVMADWENQCYYTFDPKYVANELQMFWKLYEKGIIYYDLKPVYWSPSSNTALAESELLYLNHKSSAVTARFQVIQDTYPEPLYLLVWTTTPWTLPLNKAVYCSPKLKYSIVKISTFPGLYILASDLINQYREKLNVEITEKDFISCEDIKNFKYKHPWNSDKIMRVYVSSNIRLSGTGLLHSVPGHGHEDFVMGLENNLEVECSVDEKGCYTENAGSELVGLNVLNEGSKFVVERLASDILLEEEYNHSYPYDWRTNKPVIIRASKQWFIDCEKLRDKAVESLRDVDVPHAQFLINLKTRPYWCLSRQKKWGVPIPAFFHKTSDRPILTKDLIDHLSHLVLTRGPDVWWTENIETLIPAKFCSENYVRMEDIVKGEDIMDIWFDSGSSWSYALNGKISELYLEGVDQYNGWFQSSLLTSVAVRSEAPYKKIKTHGFAVDDKGQKMSKSLGNIMDPEKIIEGNNAFGVDVLRWWVASHGHHELVPVSNKILQADSESIEKIRSSLRFLLGALNDVTPENLINVKLNYLDRYLLNCCYEFYHSLMNCYNSYDFHKSCTKILFFISNEISSRYVTVIKDRLYCDEINSVRRRACQYTINGIINTLSHTLAPILPHLAEEIYLHHPIYRGRETVFKNKWKPEESWKDDSVCSAVELLDSIKKEISTNTSLSKMICKIQLNEEEFKLLKNFQGAEQSNDSELTEILQVAEVELKVGERSITLSPTSLCYCERCRRHTATEENKLCNRCEIVVSNLLKPLTHSEIFFSGTAIRIPIIKEY